MRENLPLEQPAAGVLDTPAVCIQINLEWLDALVTATERLEWTNSWAEGTDMAYIRREVLRLQDYLVDVRDCRVTEAPFWNDADGSDADGEVPEDDQHWYGDFYDPDSTFQENLENWLIAAFIAASGQAGAAIAFFPLARKFRLAWRTRDYGSIVKVVVDAAEYGQVDTYSATPGLTHLDVVLPDDGEPHRLIIENTGTHNAAAVPKDGQYWMEVVRKRLWEEEVDAITDMRTVGGQIQIMRDDGAGWQSVTDANYVRWDGSLNPDMAGQFKVKPLVDTPAAIIQRALISATSDILQIQTEAGANLTAIESDGTFAFRNSAVINRIRAANSTLDIRFGSNSPLILTATTAVLEASLQVIGSNFRQQARISGTLVDQFRSITTWNDATLATRKARVNFEIADAAAYREFMRAASNGSAPQIAFLGQSPAIPRQTLTGDFAGNVAGKNLATALASFGLITDSTTLGTVPGAIDTCRLAFNLAYRIEAPLKIIMDSMRQSSIDGDTNAQVAEHGAALYSEYYGSDVWWDDPDDTESYILSFLDTYGTDSVPDLLLTVYDLMLSSRDAYWQGSLKNALDTHDGAITTAMLGTLRTQLTYYFEPQFGDFIYFLGTLITRTAIAAYQNMGAAALLGASGNCTPPAIVPVTSCTDDAHSDGAGFIKANVGGYYGGVWSATDQGWNTTYNAGLGANAIGLRQACYLSVVPSMIGLTVSQDYLSNAGVSVIRVSDGALVKQLYRANLFPGAESEALEDSFASSPGTGWFYLDVFGSSGTGRLTIHKVRIY